MADFSEIIDVEKRVTEAQIREVEQTLGIVLPDDYRSFMKRYSGGRLPGRLRLPGEERVPGGWIDHSLGAFYPLRSIGPLETADDPKVLRVSRSRQLVSIGDVAGLRVVAIACKGPDRGAVFAYATDREHAPAKVSASFSKFFKDICLESRTPEETDPIFAAIETRGWRAFSRYTGAAIDPDRKNERGETLLRCAVRAQRPRIVKWLVEAGADVNQNGFDGRNVLEAALTDTQISRDCLSILLAAKAECGRRNLDGETLLTYAIKIRQNVEVVLTLIDGGCDVNAENAVRETPLMCCVWDWWFCGERVFQSLLEAGADRETSAKRLYQNIRQERARTLAPNVPSSSADVMNNYELFGVQLLRELAHIESVESLARDGVVAAILEMEDVWGEATARDALIAVATSSSAQERQRCAAIRGLEAHLEERVHKLLVRLRRDSSANVRDAVAKVLKGLGNSR